MNRQQRRQAAKRKGAADSTAADPRMAAARQAHQAGRHGEALAVYDQLLSENPRHPEALHFKGLLAFQQGQNAAAVEMLRSAIKLRRGVPSFHGNLANVLLNMGDSDGAEAEFRKAIRLDKGYAMAHSNLGTLLLGAGRIEEAESAVRKAIALQPDNFEAYTNLGAILRRQGRIDAATAALRQALTINPDHERAFDNLIFLRDFDPAVSLPEQQQLRREWAERFADPLTPAAPEFDNDRDPERKLRIGYVTGDFRNHSAAISFAPVILERDREQFEAYCYMTSARRDVVTDRFEASADAWRACWGKPDAAVAKMIRRDAIDVLVDLSGHSAGNRLLVFARKPAPVQVTAWGHCTGTGMKAMDHFLADAVVMPKEDAAHCRENVIELSCALGFSPPDAAPDAAPGPAARNGFVTFGCLNRIEKVGDETLAAWGRIMAEVSGSRLYLKSAALDDAKVRAETADRLHAHGIAASRVEMAGRTSWSEHMDAYGQIDIALDPFPNTGGISTLETLWMGVPVVTLRGATPAGRMAAAILTAGGYPEWIGETMDAYVATAVGLASAPSALSDLRRELRPHLGRLPVGNPVAYAREVEAVYRTAWREWSAGA